MRTTWSAINILLLLLIFNTTVAQLYIRGFVFDAESRTPLQQAIVILKNADSGKELQKTKTGSDGQFEFETNGASTFIVEASFRGYSSNSSPKFYFAELQDLYTLDKIYLKKTGSPVNIPPPDTLPPQQVLDKRFHGLQILPTQGAYELFYALNPALKNGKPIPENHTITYPRFPDFGEYRKTFNHQFKKDKRRGEPRSSFKSHSINEGLVNNVKSRISPIFNSNLNVSDNIAVSSDIAFQNGHSTFEKLKKFVFVIWKDGPDGKPITDGDSVQGKYLVIYYLGRMKGDTGSYYKAPDATYGYAPMGDNRYYIEVYEQSTMKKVRTSDDIIDPHSYFERKDIWVSFNISYTKILLHVLPN